MGCISTGSLLLGLGLKEGVAGFIFLVGFNE